MSRDLGGKTAGGFKLGDILARGANSTVYAAEPTAGGQQVAVKVLSYDLLRDKGTAAKLVADVQRATAVKHKNLVPVLEVGTVENKGKRYLFIAMERLHGESLQARLNSQPAHALPLHVALQIASEVGGALQAIQRAGGNHRQVNPGAVFLVPPTDDERRADPEAEDQIYLLDLGVALVPTEPTKEPAKEPAKPSKPAKPTDDVRGLAMLVQDMLGGLPDSVAAGQNAVLPLRWRNRKVPARIDAVLRQASSESSGTDKSTGKSNDKSDKSGDKGGRIDSVATLVAELLGVTDALPTLHAFSEDGRVAMAKPARSWNLLWAAGLALVGGTAVGYWMYQDTPATPPALVDLARPVVSDLAQSAAVDLGASPATRPSDGAVSSPPDAGAAEPRPRVWPKRTGPKIPPLREADSAPPAAAAPAAPAAGKAAAAPSPAASPGKPPAPATTPPTATNQQPTGNPGTSPPPARPAREQEVK